MAKGTGRKRSKKAAAATGASPSRAVRLEKALAASLRREAKAASRLEAAQIEVAVLRVALAEVVGEGAAVPAPEAIAVVVTPSAPKPAAARPRGARVAATAKTRPPKAPTARTTPAPKATAGSRGAVAKPAAPKPVAKRAAPARARRSARPGPGAGAPDR